MKNCLCILLFWTTMLIFAQDTESFDPMENAEIIGIIDGKAKQIEKSEGMTEEEKEKAIKILKNKATLKKLQEIRSQKRMFSSKEHQEKIISKILDTELKLEDMGEQELIDILKDTAHEAVKIVVFAKVKEKDLLSPFHLGKDALSGEILYGLVEKGLGIELTQASTPPPIYQEFIKIYNDTKGYIEKISFENMTQLEIELCLETLSLWKNQAEELENCYKILRDFVEVMAFYTAMVDHTPSNDFSWHLFHLNNHVKHRITSLKNSVIPQKIQEAKKKIAKYEYLPDIQGFWSLEETIVKCDIAKAINQKIQYGVVMTLSPYESKDKKRFGEVTMKLGNQNVYQKGDLEQEIFQYYETKDSKNPVKSYRYKLYLPTILRKEYGGNMGGPNTFYFYPHKDSIEGKSSWQCTKEKHKSVNGESKWIGKKIDNTTLLTKIKREGYTQNWFPEAPPEAPPIVCKPPENKEKVSDWVTIVEGRDRDNQPWRVAYKTVITIELGFNGQWSHRFLLYLGYSGQPGQKNGKDYEVTIDVQGKYEKKSKNFYGNQGYWPIDTWRRNESFAIRIEEEYPSPQEGWSPKVYVSWK